MFGFFRKLAAEGLQVTDLRFSSHSTFRAYVDGLCSHAGSGWKRVSLAVEVPGYPELEVLPLSIPTRTSTEPGVISGCEIIPCAP